ncbi:MAG: amidohydrolase family protein [Chloroflexi bacterium]|nr:amidohydrolase family protein [Chloroflexota bacterium]
MSSLLIKNIHTIATLDAQATELHDNDILIDGPVIKAIGPHLTPPPGTRVIDGSSKVALPGFVNTHHHMYQIYTRDLPRTANALDIWDWLKINYDIWHELDPELVYVSALVGLGLLLKTGCTLVSDLFYVFPDTGDKKLIDAEIQAAKEIGVRFHPTRGSMSLDQAHGGMPPLSVVQTDEEIMLDSERLVNTYHDPSPFSMLRIALAPCSPFSVTSNLMRETIKYARQHGLHCHTHLAEAALEDDWCKDMFGMRPFEYMESLDWVGPDVWYAHSIYVNDEEIRRMGQYRCGVASCPVCNARAGHGIAKILDMRAQGVRVGFGVDGAGGYGDMIAELQTALVLHRYMTRDMKPMSTEMLRIASQGGAQVLGWDELGSLEVGKAADLSLIDTRQLDYAGATHDLVSSVVLFGANHIVDTTIVNGEVVVEKGRLTRVDEDAIVEKANKLSKDFIARASRVTGVDYSKVPVRQMV